MMIILYIVFFLTIGLWLSLKGQEKRLIPKEFLYISSIATSLLISYFIFFFYIHSPESTHKVISYLALFSPLFFSLFLYSSWKQTVRLKIIREHYLLPLLVTLLTLIVYTSLFYSCVSRLPGFGGYNEVDNRTFCHISNLPFDNALPFIYGENVLESNVSKPAIDWSIADRPPLQIAATIPLLAFADNSLQFNKFAIYNLFSVFLQLSWIGAVWAILRWIRLNKKNQALILIGFSAVGFFYLNSVFVWPKLLAASLVVSGAVIFLANPNRKFSYNYLPLLAIFISLGLLSHSGVLFTVLPLGLFILYKMLRDRKINYRYIFVSLLLGLIILLPWFQFKSTLVKTDRLVKWHFAGIIPAEDTRSTSKTIIEEYRKLDFDQWENNKKQNIKALVTGNTSLHPQCALATPNLLNGCLASHWRTLTFFSTLFAFELFNVGWLVLAYRLIKNKLDNFDVELIILSIASLIFWVLAMFLPGSTIVHQGSYAAMILMFILLGKNMSTLPSYLFAPIVVAQIGVFYVVWIRAFNIF